MQASGSEQHNGVHWNLAALIAVAVTVSFLILVHSASALTVGIGWSGDPGRISPEIDVVSKSGAQLYRVPLGYAPGNPAANDGTVLRAAEDGVKIDANLAWGGNSLPSGGERSEWTSWAAGLVSRYGYAGTFWSEHAGLYDPITIWEIGNEPNATAVSATEFGAFVNEAANAMHAAEKEPGQQTEILTGGLKAVGLEETATAIGYLEGAYPEFSSNSYVTGIAIHPYDFQVGSIANFQTAVKEFHQSLEGLAPSPGSAKALWLTESGWPVNWYGINEAEQASILGEAINWAKEKEGALNLKAYIWYDMQDNGGNTSWADACGLRNEAGAFRPSWYAFQSQAGVAQTTPQAPAATTGGDTGVTSTQATILGTVSPHGLMTTYQIEWGATTSYGHMVTGEAGNGEGPQSVESTLAHLAPNTTYHYRVVATNAIGTTAGADQTFSTQPGVVFVDASNNDSLTEWGVQTGTGWQQTRFGGDKVAKGTSPSVAVFNGITHVLFVDENDNDAISDWSVSNGSSPKLTHLFRDSAAPGSSPSAVVFDGVLHVLFNDKSDNEEVSDWSLSPEAGWNLTNLYRDKVASGTSPSATEWSGALHVLFNDESDNDELSEWGYSAGAGWNLTSLYGHTVAAGTSPSTYGGPSNVDAFYVDATEGDTLSDRFYSPGVGWQQASMGGDQVASGTSPSAVLTDGGASAHVFFVDANTNDSISDRYWSSTGWQQLRLYGHEVAAGSSPTAAVNNGLPQAYYADASDGGTITGWIYNATAGWQQQFFYGHTVSAGSSPTVATIEGSAQIFSADAGSSDTITQWSIQTGTGWIQTPIGEAEVAAGSSGDTAVIDGVAHVFFNDKSDNERISYWTDEPGNGWNLTHLYVDKVAKGSSPSVAVFNGAIHILFVDESDNDEISDWSNDGGWHLTHLYRDQASPGTSPSAIVFDGVLHVLFNDKSDNEEVSDWSLSPEAGWNLTNLYRDKVAKGTSPDSTVWNGSMHVLFNDESDNDELSDWSLTPGAGWNLTSLYGHTVAAGTSPSTLPNSNLNVFYVDATEGNTLSDRFYAPTYGWLQTSFGGDQITAGTSPSAVATEGGAGAHVFFVDANTNNSIADRYVASGAWQQLRLYGHAAGTGSSPSAF